MTPLWFPGFVDGETEIVDVESWIVPSRYEASLLRFLYVEQLVNDSLTRCDERFDSLWAHGSILHFYQFWPLVSPPNQLSPVALQSRCPFSS